MSGQHYAVIEESVSAHCCFAATVIDTTKNKVLDIEYNVCECMELSQAVRICELLNESELMLSDAETDLEEYHISITPDGVHVHKAVPWSAVEKCREIAKMLPGHKGEVCVFDSSFHGIFTGEETKAQSFESVLAENARFREALELIANPKTKLLTSSATVLALKAEARAALEGK